MRTFSDYGGAIESRAKGHGLVATSINIHHFVPLEHSRFLPSGSNWEDVASGLPDRLSEDFI